jgi:NADH:ubiquinone oxidoreductase subunit 2 (subunit N)
MLLFFCIILATNYKNLELKELSKLSTFSKKNAVFSSLLTLTILNIGGLPPTLGFFGKFYIFLEVSFRGD